MSLHAGLGLFTGQVPPDSSQSVAQEYADILALAQVAEDVGFDSFWVSEHHNAEDAYLPSMTVMLGALAAVTKRMVLGTAVVLGPFQHPLRFAEDCAVVDQLSRGRLLIGLGSGWRAEEFRAFNIPIKERASRTAELAQVCRLAWDNDQFSFQGKHFQYENVSVTPRPYGSVPLMLGGSVEAAIRRAGRLGDGFIGTPQKRFDLFREQVAIFDAAAREAGKDPSTMPIGLHINAWVSPDGSLPETVRQAMWHQIGTYAMWHAVDDGDPAAQMPPIDDQKIRDRAFIGTPAEVVAEASPWVRAFGNRDLHIIFRLQYPGMHRAEAEAATRLFGSEVIPALKALAP